MKLKEAKRHYCSCIYCLEFPNGMKYVGKTKDLPHRIGLYERFGGSSNVNHLIQEYGLDSIDLTILSKVNCRNQVDLELCLSILEIKYIRELNTLSPNGLNVSLGGEVLGIPVEHLTTDSDIIDSYNKSAKSVLIYDLEGKFVAEYPSIARCAYEYGIVDDSVIRYALDKNKIFIEKYYLRTKRYDYAPKSISVSATKVRERVIYEDVLKERVKYKDVIVKKEIEKLVERKVVIKPHILRYDIDGNFCGEYENLSDACLSFTGSSSGIRCGMYRKGYILFKKENDNYPTKIEPYEILSKKVLGDYYRPANELIDKAEPLKKKTKIEFELGKPKKEKAAKVKKVQLCVDGKYTNIKLNFPIEQYALNGELIASFDSIRDASCVTCIPYSQIYANVNGKTKKCKGYIFKKKES